MEFAGFFILLVVLVALAVLGGGLYLLSMWLRGKKLASGGDEIEGEQGGRPRPERVEVESEQRARFIGTR